MRKINYLIILGIIFSLELQAKKIEGKIIFQTDTLNVVFDIPIKTITQEPNYEKLQYEVEYYTTTSKQTLLAYQAKEIRFNYNGEEIRMLSRKSLDINSPVNKIFLKLEIDGYLKLFSYYSTQKTKTYTPNGYMPGKVKDEDNCVLQKGDTEVRNFEGINFKKDIIEYFKDCPSLLKKIEFGEFHKKDIKQIVEFYNGNCK